MQDQQQVIDAWNANASPGIEAQVYDFFTPQPVKGARAYYMRTIIHDNQDDLAKEILQSTTSAFYKDSMLLINDIVLPDSGMVRWRAIMVAQDMMSSLAAKGRTEKELYALLGSVGLETIKI
ncbi:S-adenosyl-L-methionine-dependent methyltransferase [Lentithecium fluviatile CBS 122367]|uniref:S-adenosyl-L-methionine-dependent methyltransferase n=1 Tax=Lentithecium fluviatile CBS 122367 TaxID=1168545 RepID=A0A6G1IWL7_9PLEO|nr:S-adenosyl-L-methionine-dependent methyltransferase [Lentithecium fluviatile CBS 122367]